MKNKKNIIIIGIVVTILGMGFYFNRKEEYQITKLTYFEYFDTIIEVSIYEEVEDKEELDDLVKNELIDIYEMTDAFNDHNNEGLYTLNKEGSVDNERLAGLIQYAIDYYNNYSNQFNIALAPVIDIWKEALEECNENNNCSAPSVEELENAGNINASDVIVDGSTVTIEEKMKIDLGAIAKGYCSDELVKLLKANGYEYFLINAGGNIYGTTKPDKVPYTVSVVDPVDTQSSFVIFNIENKSVVTSGDYERYFEVDGVRYSHLINNETLFPSNYFHSVTIISDKSIDGDILSTLLFNTTYEEGLEIVEKRDDIEAVWYTTSGEILKSSGIDSYEKK
ncbi:MAG: FAD:protein FMN transferase [Bacilli bacterium]